MKSPSRNGPAADRAGTAITIRLAIGDPDLAAKVRRELAASAMLVEGAADAILVLTDRSVGSPSGQPVPAAPAWTEREPHLSPREQEVAGLLLEGASNKGIARRLDISVHTVKFHVTQILEKLGAQNRADAVSIILRDGLVTL